MMIILQMIGSMEQKYPRNEDDCGQQEPNFLKGASKCRDPRWSMYLSVGGFSPGIAQLDRFGWFSSLTNTEEFFSVLAPCCSCSSTTLADGRLACHVI
jgi:hypothetical protein